MEQGPEEVGGLVMVAGRPDGWMAGGLAEGGEGEAERAIDYTSMCVQISLKTDGLFKFTTDSWWANWIVNPVSM